MSREMFRGALTLTIAVVIGVAFMRMMMNGSSNISLYQNTPAGPPSTNPACADPPMDQCSFYTDCLESRYHCGPDGYPIGYGEKFCQTFSDDRSKLDAQGQRWMVDTMHCLQLALVPDAIDTNATVTSCDALKHQAFASHAGCYARNGFCSLGVHNWAAILEIVDVKTLFSSWDALKATIQAAVECEGYYAYMVERGLF